MFLARDLAAGEVFAFLGPMNLNLLLSVLLMLGMSSAQIVSNRAVGAGSDNRPQSGGARRLLTWNEGVEVIKVAWKNLSKFDSEIDCSHLVNQIYELAGLHYDYATSNQLYDGVDPFERVSSPQPADLIVWPGHVGVVVNPQEHSFYSSLNSGLKIDSYDSPTWQARGQARFFRLVVRNRDVPLSTGTDVLSARARDDESDNTADTVANTPARERAPAILDSRPRPKLVSRTSSDEIFLKWARPKKAQAQTALLQAWNSPSEDRQDKWQEASQVVIVQTLKVERISLNRSSGTLLARIKSAARLTPDEIQIQPSTAAVTFRLVRGQNGWRVESPTGRMYLAGDAAVVAISEHLATIARESASREEQAEAAALLHSLLR